MAVSVDSEASVASALWAVNPEVSRCQVLQEFKLNLLVLVALEVLEPVVLEALGVQEVPEAQVPLVLSLTLSLHWAEWVEWVEWADSIHS